MPKKKKWKEPELPWSLQDELNPDRVRDAKAPKKKATLGQVTVQMSSVVDAARTRASAARDGVHSGDATRCCVSTAPEAARASSLGVFIVVFPLKPKSP